MGKLTDEQLDDLFRDQLLGLEKIPPNEIWSTLGKSTAKNNFLKFGLKHFNIFYVAIISAISISGIIYFAAIKSLPIIEEKPTLPQNINLPKKSIGEPSKNIYSNNNSGKQRENIKINTSSSANKNELPTEQSVVDSSSILLSSQTIDSSQENKKEEPLKTKKIITLIKRDTLRVIDTINVKRFRR